MFGLHLMLEFYDCEEKKLEDTKFIVSVLEELPEIIGMRKISEPYVIKVPPNPSTFDKGGISAFIIIAESHIAIHTFTKQRYATIDVFSCKEFDTKKAEEYLVEKFKPRLVERNVLSRGRNFKKS